MIDFSNLPAKDKIYYQDDACVVYCADNREVLPLFEDKVFDLVLTDPPYGMNYDTNGDRFTLGGRTLPPVFGDDKPFDPQNYLFARATILWGFNHFPYGLPAGGALIWIKRTENAFGQFLSDAEIAWCSIGRGVYCYSDTHHAIACKREHPTQKPVGLMRWCIEKIEQSDLILDPFLGSGTTAVAAKILGRKCIGIEISEKYCEIAAKRLSQSVMQLEIPKETIKQEGMI